LALLASAFLALDQKQKTVSVWKELARILGENNQTAQALEVHRRILSVLPDDPDSLAAVGGRRAFGTGQPKVIPSPAAAPAAPRGMRGGSEPGERPQRSLEAAPLVSGYRQRVESPAPPPPPAPVPVRSMPIAERQVPTPMPSASLPVVQA